MRLSIAAGHQHRIPGEQPIYYFSVVRSPCSVLRPTHPPDALAARLTSHVPRPTNPTTAQRCSRPLPRSPVVLSQGNTARGCHPNLELPEWLLAAGR